MNRYIALTAATAAGPLAAAFLHAGVAVADTAGSAAEISDNAFTVDGTTFDPGSDGYNDFPPFVGIAPLLKIGFGSLGLGGATPQTTQDFDVYSGGSDVGTAHTSVNGSDLLGIDSAQFTIQSVTPPVADVQAALTNSDLDFSGAGINVSDLANILDSATQITFGSGDITSNDVLFALLGSGITLPSSITDADIADVLNGIDLSGLPDAGTVYSITNLGSGYANVYEAVPNADGTAASSITDTLVTPFGNLDVPTDYDAIAPIDPGAAFTGLGATSDNSSVSDNAFALDGFTFDPGSDGFTPVFPLLGVAPLLEIGGGNLVLGTINQPLAVQDLEVYGDSGSDIGNVNAAESVQNLLGFASTQLTVDGYNLPESDVVSALTDSGVDFSSAGTTATDVANALPGIGLDSDLTASQISGYLFGSGISLSFADEGTIADALNSASAGYTPSADLPDEGTVYSVTNFGNGYENVYIATPNDDGTAAASITDTLVTPNGNFEIPTTYDAIAPMDPGAPFAGLGVASDASGVSDNAFTIDGTTFDPGTDGFDSVTPTAGIAPLLEIGGGALNGLVNFATQDLDVYGSSGELGSVETAVNTANILGLIGATQLTVSGYDVPASDFVGAFDNSDISFTGADFDASDLVTALEDHAENAALFDLTGGDLTGSDITTALFGSGIDLSAAGIDPDDVASVINGAVDAYGADLPDLGTVYSVTDFGGGFENVYEAIPNADGSAASSITDYLVTPFGNFDLSTMFDAIAPLMPGDAAAGVSDAASGGFDLFDPSTWF
jgi:hypothetical protein